MDYLLLTRVIQELNGILTGGRIGRVYQDDAGNICLVVTRARKSYPLLLSPDRALPRMHLLSEKPGSTAVPSGFTLYLRSHLTGARVDALSVVGADRIAEIRLTLRGRECRLLFEMFGPSPNIFLISGDGVILAVHRPLPPGEGVRRPLWPGMAYTPPERKPGRTERSTPSDSDAAVPRALAGEAPVNKTVEQMYDRMVTGKRAERLRTELSAALKKALARAERRAASISRDLDKASHAEEYRMAGELVLANLKLLKRGAESAELEGYSGEKIVVPLDPLRTPSENAELYFKKYKKAKAGLAIISRRLEDARNEASSLRKRLDELASSDIPDAIESIRIKIAREGLLQVRAGHGAAERRTGAALPYRKFTYAGWDILVGKNAAGNDELSGRLARPEDLWFHADAMPGSHVLIRNPRREEIPVSVIETAASLAAYYSRGRGGDKVTVAYTQAKYVKKPKGAKPGLVTLARRRTIVVRPNAPAGMDVS